MREGRRGRGCRKEGKKEGKKKERKTETEKVKRRPENRIETTKDTRRERSRGTEGRDRGIETRCRGVEKWEESTENRVGAPVPTPKRRDESSSVLVRLQDCSPLDQRNGRSQEETSSQP